MKKILSILIFAIAALVVGIGDAMAQKAFPSAIGYAENITGGRGGKVYYVTRLDDCSDDNLIPGTFRWALRSGDNTPRTILFAVGGTILTTSPLKANHNNVSILGQSAPGGGICITGYGLELNGVKNYIVRYLRFRAGEVPCYAEAPEGQHVDVNNGSFGVENSANIIVDHCSITWSNEECMTMFDNETTTVQHCIIGEGLYHSWHHKYENNGTSGRGYAMQWGGEYCNMHHTLITNSNSRSPRYNGVREENAWLPGKTGVKKHAHDCFSESDFANNVTFNWGGAGSIYGGEFYAYRFDGAPDSLQYFSRTYLTNNYYRPGPTTMSGAKNERYFIRASGSVGDKSLGQWYLNGNKFEVDGTYSTKSGVWAKASLEAVNADNYYGIANGLSGRGFSTDNGVSQTIYNNYILKSRPALSGYQPVSAEQAYAETMADCGANLPRIDEVDQRLVDEAAGKVAPKFKGSRVGVGLGIIDTPNDIKLTGKQDKFWYKGEYTNTVNGQTFTCYPYLGLNEEDRYAVDSDADGMPDAYEDAKGLNKNDPSDGAMIASNGYTNLENYLNAIVDGSISNADYQTSVTYVAPGAALDGNITISFANDDPEIFGNAPKSMTINVKNRDAVIFLPSWTFYKEGYTMTGWTDGNMTYSFDTDYTGYFTQDVCLYPSMTKNKKNITDRTDDMEVVWDFTQPTAPSLGDGSKGIYVTRAYIDNDSLDVMMQYEGMLLTLPAADGAIATVVYANGSQKEYAASGNTLTISLTSNELRKVEIIIPYIFDPTGITFHSPAVATCTAVATPYVTIESGEEKQWPGDENAANAKNFNPNNAKNYELVYGNLATVKSLDWMETAASQERDAFRNCIDPTKETGTYSTDGAATTSLRGFIVGPSYKLVAYVKDCAKVVTYASGSNSTGDQIILTAIPSDGSERVTAYNLHKLSKSFNLSETFEMELDPEKSYRLMWSSVAGYDMMVGAVKFYDKTAKGETKGDVTVSWPWLGTPDVNGSIDPSKAVSSAIASYGEGWDIISNNASEVSFAHKDGMIDEKDAAEYAFKYVVTPAPSVKFKPTKFSFCLTSEGECNVKVAIKRGNNEEQILETIDIEPFEEYEKSYDIIDDGSTTPFSIILYPYNLEELLNIGLSAINVKGTYDSSLPKHSFITVITPEGAGAIKQSPRGKSFATDSEISLSATPASGYVFKNWTDNSGAVISDKAMLAYTMPDNDVTLYANFFTEADYPEIFTGGPYNAVVGNAEQLLIALRAASSTSESRYRIFLKNGIYDLGKTAMTAVPANTSLIGESQDGVLIMNNPDVIPGGNNYQDLTPTLFIDENQNNIYMQDFTVRQARDWEKKTSQGQALAIRQRGKQAVYKNVSIEGVQDTYYLNKADGTAYFEDCTVAGEVDFIYGDGTMFFQNCTLLPVSSGAKITAANTKENYMGIVFNDCVIDRHPEAKDAVTGYALGRCWDDSPCVTYLNTTMKVLPLEAGWQGMTDGLLIRYHEYGSKNANGDAIDLSKRSISACKPAQGSHKPVITAEEAAGYSLDKVFPAWNPQNVTSQLALDNAPVKTSTSLNWNTVDGAYCYAVVKDGNVIGFTQDTSFALDDANAIYNVRVANMMGGLGVMSADAVAGSNVMPGDANGDGQVSVADLSLMASYVLGSDVTINMQNADVNNDGQISVADLSKVASIILQIEARRSRF